MKEATAKRRGRNNIWFSSKSEPKPNQKPRTTSAQTLPTRSSFLSPHPWKILYPNPDLDPSPPWGKEPAPTTPPVSPLVGSLFLEMTIGSNLAGFQNYDTASSIFEYGYLLFVHCYSYLLLLVIISLYFNRLKKMVVRIDISPSTPVLFRGKLPCIDQYCLCLLPPFFPPSFMYFFFQISTFRSSLFLTKDNARRSNFPWIEFLFEFLS